MDTEPPKQPRFRLAIGIDLPLSGLIALALVVLLTATLIALHPGDAFVRECAEREPPQAVRVDASRSDEPVASPPHIPPDIGIVRDRARGGDAPRSRPPAGPPGPPEATGAPHVADDLLREL